MTKDLDKSKRKILLVSPEVFPYAKTGGLADVVGALSKVLAQLGCEVKTILPRYRIVEGERFNMRTVDISLPEIVIGEKKVKFWISREETRSQVEPHRLDIRR